MKQGFIKTAAVTPRIKVDVPYNEEQIKLCLTEACGWGA